MLEAIITCVNYDDFLKITLKENRKYFDDCIIITAEKDTETPKIAQDNNCQCIITDAFYAGGALFNRGLAIDVALSFVKHKDWILILDADILLPKNFDNLLNIKELEKEYFYGCRRYSLPVYQDLQKENLNDNVLFRGFGFGFFQLFNWNSFVFQNLLKKDSKHPYPWFIPTTQESDWMFRDNWGSMCFEPPLLGMDCHKKKNSDYSTGLVREIKNINVKHLGIEGLNEKGRITAKFE